jgi:hypothetical protein
VRAHHLPPISPLPPISASTAVTEQALLPLSNELLVFQTIFIPFLFHILKQLILMTTGCDSQPPTPPTANTDNKKLVPITGGPIAKAQPPASARSMENLLMFFDSPLWLGFILVQLISIVLVFNLEECSPIVLFSWWRNKIS